MTHETTLSYPFIGCPEDYHMEVAKRKINQSSLIKPLDPTCSLQEIPGTNEQVKLCHVCAVRKIQTVGYSPAQMTGSLQQVNH